MAKVNKQDAIAWAVILSETTHLFCCVLPVIFSLLSLASGIGMTGAVPTFVMDLHDALHDYEIPMIIASGIILAIGWVAYLYSQELDCVDDGCHHTPCGPKKTYIILLAATVLFAVNVSVYFVFHRGAELGLIEQAHDHNHNHNHNHNHEDHNRKAHDDHGHHSHDHHGHDY